jgi:DNA polymerase-3 subunit epsilon
LSNVNVDVEKAAQQLEAHPDFKVLRRLVPRDAFEESAAGPIATAVVLDTETTGRDHDTDKVIEIALVKFEYEVDTGRVIRVSDVYSGLEDPGFPIPAETIAIHGITDDMVAGHQLDDARIAEFMVGTQWVIAHNASFDRPFTEARLPLFKDVAWACTHVQIPWADEGFSGSKLEYLAWSSGFFYDAHRSEVDCRALLELLRHPLPKSKQIALHALLTQAAEPVLRLWATGSPFDSKDVLRIRGYRWDAARKVWHRVVAKSAAAEESVWLKEHVYKNRPAQIEVEVIDAKIRFADRPGPRKTRVI